MKIIFLVIAILTLNALCFAADIDVKWENDEFADFYLVVCEYNNGDVAYKTIEKNDCVVKNVYEKCTIKIFSCKNSKLILLKHGDKEYSEVGKGKWVILPAINNIEGQ